jgi:hypothetical protein
MKLKTLIKKQNKIILEMFNSETPIRSTWRSEYIEKLEKLEKLNK